MFKYWVKNRILFDILIPIVLVIITAFAFLSPMFSNIGETRLMLSLYESENLDFDIPSPSYEQISQLEDESFIESIFPYFYTKVDLSVDGKTRETNLFFSDAFDKLDQTMYCQARLIEKSDQNYSNPILVDYEFIQDTGASLGSTVSVIFGTTKIDFQVSAIYETNTYYEGGAAMAKWEGLQKDTIMAISPKLVYSGAYVQASDYAQCKNYLETQYKPYGRLKDVSEFATQEAYEIHYNAFMSANYANEITNFTTKGQEVKVKAEAEESSSTLYTVLPCVIIAVVLLVYNILLWLRKSERGYFARREVSGGGNTFVYYLISTLVQAAILIGGIVGASFIVSSKTSYYIPSDIAMAKSVVLIIVTVCVSVVMAVENMVLALKTKK